VATAGDVLSQLVADEGIGVVVPPGDVDAVAEGIRQMAAAPPSRETVRAAAQRFRWDTVAAPLLEFCADPWRAADLGACGPRTASQQVAEPDQGPPSAPEQPSWGSRAARSAYRVVRRWIP
jgi:hypothetical protein